MGFFNKKNEVELTNQEKVQQAKQTIETSLGMFANIYGDLEQANAVLETVIAEDTALIEVTQSNISSAQSELESNRALQDKIKVFIKEQ